MQQYKNPDFNTLTAREWLVTNGLGGYASSTLCGANTRRYHGLLVAAFNPPTDRWALVSKVEEKLNDGETSVELSSNAFPGVVHPQGYQYQESFERSPLPRATFQAGASRLAKTVFMVHGSNTTIVEYENIGNRSFTLELTPLFVFRDYHSLFHESDYYDYYHQPMGERALKIHAHYGARPVCFAYSHGQFVSRPDWFRQFEYEKERYRGLDYREDARSIGQLHLSLEPGENAFLAFTTEEEMAAGDPTAWKAAEIERLEALRPASESDFFQDLAVSGDQFLAQRKATGNYTLIAGYHWFTDWGRDTMIAMRGLAVGLGKKEVSESIIRTFLQYLDGGMLPNRFPDQGEAPEYNTIDATLWLFVVLHEYYGKFQDKAFVREVFPRLAEVLEAHRKGTRYGIHVTKEGLLYGGEGLSQLTWMDARVGDYVVTPRHGCPVEVNALWYNALCIYAAFGDLLGEETGSEKKQARQLARAFRKYFVNDKGYLNDVVIPDVFIDDAMRPNQIYAVSLPFSPVSKKEAQSVLAQVEKELYTGLGLRSLSTGHPDFRPAYGGNQWDRDGAYHQGTVWAFLWGEYALAYLKVNNHSGKAREEIKKKSEALRRHFYEEACLYGISEIFDGENPKEGRGCIQQAWSVGMLLKVFNEINVNQPKSTETWKTEPKPLPSSI
ncbi:MAG: glycogen debranching enzyme N-terminal domain-containing protein [Phaeodactylibacter sp.]|nr:glycogen debranching enzyme N-terminal domain-containing protein [Phaeodactylibacter sp.]